MATTVLGTSGNDLFSFSLAELASRRLLGGAGFDTLTITTSGAYTFNSSSYAGLSGIDALDFSAHTSGSLVVKLTSSMVTQSDSRTLKVVSGAAGIDALSAGAVSNGKVVVDGIGTVRLDDATANVVTIADLAAVHVIGGNGADRITGGAGGAWLDGGGGNDTLTASLLAGADTFVLGAGYGADKAINFSVAQDVVSLTGTSVMSFADVLAMLSDSGSGAVVRHTSGATLTLTSVGSATLTGDNFRVDGQALLNTAPVASAPVADQAATTGQAFSFAIVAGAFTDADRNVLTHSASLESGEPLPSWLAFDAATRTFSGTPGDGDAGMLSITVTADDGHGASVSDTFALIVLTPIIHVAAGTSAASINALIAAAGTGATIILDNGVHHLDQTLRIARGDITLRGESEAGTVLSFDTAAGASGNVIEVLGGARMAIGFATGAIAAGATSIEMAAGHGIAAGDRLYISQANTLEYLAANGWTNVAWEDAANRPFREMIVEVDSVDGTTIVLKSPVAYAMDAGLAQVQRIALLDGVHLSDFTIVNDLGGANPFNFVNTHAELEGTSAVLVQGTAGAELRHISVVDAASHGIDIRSSIGLVGDALTVAGAHNKGSDGNGYGLQLYEAFGATLTNLDITDTRHAVLFSSWNAEAGNSVHVTHTNRDINFHGSPDTGNTVVVDEAVLQYDQSQNEGTGNGYWPLAGTGGSMHAKTDFNAGNTVVFAHAVGSDAGETIYGADGGAYLNGKNGQDRLLGGAGDDILVGGLNKDTMTGGDGSDTFVLRLGDNYDTITDFAFGAGGDVLVLMGNAAVDGAEDLTVSDTAAGLQIRYGANSVVTLTGLTVADLDLSSLRYDPASALYADLY
jgi:Ca2+-binding RTX toxin-like protein